MKAEDETEDDLELPEPFTRIDTARVVIENLDDYLFRKKSELGVPLAYVVRDIVTLPIHQMKTQVSVYQVMLKK